MRPACRLTAGRMQPALQPVCVPSVNPTLHVLLLGAACAEVSALTSLVTSFDDLTPVVEEKETPESVEEEVTERQNNASSSCEDERMDVRVSSSDSDADSHRHQGIVAQRQFMKIEHFVTSFCNLAQY